MRYALRGVKGFISYQSVTTQLYEGKPETIRADLQVTADLYYSTYEDSYGTESSYSARVGSEWYVLGYGVIRVADGAEYRRMRSAE